MAGRRMVSDKVCESEMLAKVSSGAERLWHRLLTKTDDAGNFHAKAALVRGLCLALVEDINTKDVESWLQELASVRGNDENNPYGLIAFYDVCGTRYLHFMGFEKHQHLRKDRARTINYPQHPEALTVVSQPDSDIIEEEDITDTTPVQPSSKSIAANPVNRSCLLVSGREVKLSEVKVREEKKSEDKLSKEPPHTACPPTSVAAAPDPAQNTPDFKTFKITWERVVGKSLGRNKKDIEKYENACKAYGAADTLEAITCWAKESTLAWIKRDNIDFPFSAFIKQLPETIVAMRDNVQRDVAMNEADRLAEALPAVTTVLSQSEIDAQIMRLEAEEQQARDERAVKFAKPVDTDSHNPLDYL
jgi:hypothetical protein